MEFAVVTRLIFDDAPPETSPLPSLELSMETLFAVRAGAPSRSNMRASAADLRAELLALPRHTRVLDVAVSGRGPSEALALGDALGLRVSLCTSPALFPPEQDASRLMRADLLTGSCSTTSHKLPPADAMCVALRGGSGPLSAQKRGALRSCAQVHALGVLAPILLDPHLPMDPATLATAIAELRDSGARLERVILLHTVLSLAEVAEVEKAMRGDECVRCVDCLGYSLAHAALEHPYPSDAEQLLCVEHLCAAGLSHRLILSPHIRRKTHMRQFGGPGLAWFTETVVPAVRGDASTVAALVGETLTALLSWREPAPVLVQEQETLPCYICGARFPPGDHFEKFSFVYCSGACLAAHRRLNWSIIG